MTSKKFIQNNFLNIGIYAFTKDTKTMIASIVSLILAILYLVNNQFKTLIFFVLIAISALYLTSNLFYGLVIGIVSTVLLFSMGFFRTREGLTPIEETNKQLVDKNNVLELAKNKLSTAISKQAIPLATPSATSI